MALLGSHGPLPVWPHEGLPQRPAIMFSVKAIRRPVSLANSTTSSQREGVRQTCLAMTSGGQAMPPGKASL